MTTTDILTGLARRINEEHARCESAAATAVQHAVAAGTLLIEAKMQVSHGQWLHWVEANCTFSTRTAQGYMRIAAQADELGGNTQRVAHLPIRQALALLAEPQDPSQLLHAACGELQRLQELTTLLDFDVLVGSTPEADRVTDRFLAPAEEGLAGLEAECGGDDLATLSAVVTKATEWQHLCAEFVLRTGRATGALLAAAEKDAQVAVGGAA